MTDVINEEGCWIYFYHLDKYVNLPYMPENLQDSMTPNFQSTNALARTAPVFSYSNSGPRTVSFQFELWEDELGEVNKYNNYNALTDNPNALPSEAVDELIRIIQSIALPKYDATTKGVLPPRIMVNVGKQLRIKGVVTGAVTVGYAKPIDWDTGKYKHLTLGFSVSEDDPYDAESVSRVGSFRPTAAPSTYHNKN